MRSWPTAPPAKPWRELAAQRLAVMRAQGPVPSYAGNPVNIQRQIFGDNAATIESSRLSQEITTPPATTPSSQVIWPRSPVLLGR